MAEYKNRIRYFREQNNMTQQELAERLGTTVRTVRRWEGEETAIDVLRAYEMSKIFGVPMEEIFTFLEADI